MEIDCPITPSRLFVSCETLQFLWICIAFVGVFAFHTTAGIFKRIECDHWTDYAQGSHAVFHIEKQGLLGTKLDRGLWMVAASATSYFQADIGSAYLSQLSM